MESIIISVLVLLTCSTFGVWIDLIAKVKLSSQKFTSGTWKYSFISILLIKSIWIKFKIFQNEREIWNWIFLQKLLRLS